MAYVSGLPFGSTFRDCHMAVRFGTAIVGYQNGKKASVFIAKLAKSRGASRGDFLGGNSKECLRVRRRRNPAPFPPSDSLPILILILS